MPAGAAVAQQHLLYVEAVAVCVTGTTQRSLVRVEVVAACFQRGDGRCYDMQRIIHSSQYIISTECFLMSFMSKGSMQLLISEPDEVMSVHERRKRGRR